MGNKEHSPSWIYNAKTIVISLIRFPTPNIRVPETVEELSPMPFGVHRVSHGATWKGDLAGGLESPMPFGVHRVSHPRSKWSRKACKAHVTNAFRRSPRFPQGDRPR